MAEGSRVLISRDMVERAGIEVLGKWDEWLPVSTIDSRDVRQGGLFWALTGGRNDGHDYVEAAFQAGAGIAAVQATWASRHAAAGADRILFVMEDTLKGMQALATEVRRSVGARTLALTGSNGKTTTRELLAAALSTQGKTARSTGNYNNHIGVPLTLLNLEGDEENLVVEMGANHLGEIELLCEIAHPEAGLITNIGDAHVGEFGGYEALKRAKGELFQALHKYDGLAIVNLDDENIVDLAEGLPRCAGYSMYALPEQWRGAIYTGTVIESDPWSRVTLEIEGVRVKLSLPGRHWASAALGAAAAAIEMGVDPDLAIPALAGVQPLPGRGVVHDLREGVELLDESYNSNASAVEKLVETLAARSGKRIAVLGDILELGEFEQEEHERVGRIPALAELDEVWFVGERMFYAADEAEAMGHPGVERVEADALEELAEQVAGSLEPGAGIAVKGSRKIGLERFVEKLLEIRGVRREDG